MYRWKLRCATCPLVLLLYLVIYIRADPLQSYNKHYIKKLLQNYGFYDDKETTSDPHTAAFQNTQFKLFDDFYTSEDRLLVSAIESFQRFYRLPQTGVLTNDELQILTRPRCGTPDIRSKLDYNTTEEPVNAEEGREVSRGRRYVQGGSSWYDLRQYSPITFGLDNTAYDILTHEQTCIALLRAFRTWERAANITFLEVDFGQSVHCGVLLGLSRMRPPRVFNKPLIRIKFARREHGDSMKFDGVSGTLAHAYYPGKLEINGDMHFDMDEPWTLDEKPWTGNDLFIVAAHEIGHTLGLAHSHNRDAIMYAAYRSIETAKFHLDDDDINGIQYMYGAPKNIPPMPDVLVPPELPTEPPTEAPPRTSTIPVYRPITPRTVAPSVSPLEEVCGIEKYRAAGFFRGEFWVFADQKVYRREELGYKSPRWTIFGEITELWKELPEGSIIDDFFESRDSSQDSTNGMLYLITHPHGYSNQRMWKYNGVTIEPGWEHGKRLASLGKRTPPRHRIIGSTYWKRNDAAYLFDNMGKYYRYDVSRDEFDDQFRNRKYPADFAVVWGSGNKISSNFDTVFNGVKSTLAQNVASKFDIKNYNDKNPEFLTFFVKGQYYEIYQNNGMKTLVTKTPRHFRHDFLGCRVGHHYPEPPTAPGRPGNADEPDFVPSDDPPKPNTPPTADEDNEDSDGSVINGFFAQYGYIIQIIGAVFLGIVLVLGIALATYRYRTKSYWGRRHYNSGPTSNIIRKVQNVPNLIKPKSGAHYVDNNRTDEVRKTPLDIRVILPHTTHEVESPIESHQSIPNNYISLPTHLEEDSHLLLSSEDHIFVNSMTSDSTQPHHSTFLLDNTQSSTADDVSAAHIYENVNPRRREPAVQTRRTTHPHFSEAPTAMDSRDSFVLPSGGRKPALPYKRSGAKVSAATEEGAVVPRLNEHDKFLRELTTTAKRLSSTNSIRFSSPVSKDSGLSQTTPTHSGAGTLERSPSNKQNVSRSSDTQSPFNISRERFSYYR